MKLLLDANLSYRLEIHDLSMSEEYGLLELY